jgi:hypothetical protein
MKRSRSKRKRPIRDTSGGQSPLRLVKQFEDFKPKDEVQRLPRRLRGIYVLYQRRDITQPCGAAIIRRVDAGVR